MQCASSTTTPTRLAWYIAKRNISLHLQPLTRDSGLINTNGNSPFSTRSCRLPLSVLRTDISTTHTFRRECLDLIQRLQVANDNNDRLSNKVADNRAKGLSAAETKTSFPFTNSFTASICSGLAAGYPNLVKADETLYTFFHLYHSFLPVQNIVLCN